EAFAKKQAEQSDGMNDESAEKKRGRQLARLGAAEQIKKVTRRHNQIHERGELDQQRVHKIERRSLYAKGRCLQAGEFAAQTQKEKRARGAPRSAIARSGAKRRSVAGDFDGGTRLGSRPPGHGLGR